MHEHSPAAADSRKQKDAKEEKKLIAPGLVLHIKFFFVFFLVTDITRCFMETMLSIRLVKSKMPKVAAKFMANGDWLLL